MSERKKYSEYEYMLNNLALVERLTLGEEPTAEEARLFYDMTLAYWESDLPTKALNRESN